MAFSATLVTGNTFSNGDSATATKLNNQVNLATFQTTTASTVIGFDGSKNPLDYTLSGTGAVLATTQSPTLVTPALGTPSALVLTNATGLPNAGLINASVTIGSTAVALGATAATIAGLTLTAPALGTPASGTLTNCTGLPNAGLVNTTVTIGSTAVALGATASTIAGLTLTAPALGTPSSGTLTNCTFPTLNQNTSGTAAGLSSTLVVGSGGTGSTTVASANQGLTPGFVNYTPTTSQAVNWASGSAFFITLGGNLTITFSNAVDGQVIVILILNTASNYTVTWPGTVKWQAASAPVQTTGAHYDLYTLAYNSAIGAYFGVAAQNY